MPDRVEVEWIAVLSFEPLRHVVRVDVDVHRPSRAAGALTHDGQTPARGRVVGADPHRQDAEPAQCGTHLVAAQRRNEHAALADSGLDNCCETTRPVALVGGHIHYRVVAVDQCRDAGGVEVGMEGAGGGRLVFEDERLADCAAVRDDVDADRHRPFGPCAAAVAASTSMSQLRDAAIAPSSS